MTTSQENLQARIVEDLGEGAYRCQISEPLERYNYLIVVPECPIDRAERTRIYAAQRTGTVALEGYLVLKEFPGRLSCQETLARSGYQLTTSLLGGSEYESP